MKMTSRSVLFGGMALVAGATVAVAQVTFTFNVEAPLSAIPKSEDEFEAFLDVQEETDPENRVRLADEFLSDYSDSEYRHIILRRRFQALYDLGDWDQTIPAIEEGLVAEEAFREGKLGFLTNPEELEDWPGFQLDMANQKMIYYESLAEGYQATGDLDNALAYAEMTLDVQDEAWALYDEQNDPATPEYQEALERHNGNREFVLRTLFSIYQGRNDAANLLASAKRVLEIAPGDLEMLMNVAQIMAVEVPEDPGERSAHLEEAETYAAEAIKALEEWAASEASAQVSEDQKAGLLAQAHSNLGMIHFQTEDYARAAEAFGEATRVMPTDPALHYQLGVAYNNSQNMEGAAASLARAVYLGLDQARPALESVYQAMNGNLDGLDAFVEDEGGQVAAQ